MSRSFITPLSSEVKYFIMTFVIFTIILYNIDMELLKAPNKISRSVVTKYEEKTQYKQNYCLDNCSEYYTFKHTYWCIGI